MKNIKITDVHDDSMAIKINSCQDEHISLEFVDDDERTVEYLVVSIAQARVFASAIMFAVTEETSVIMPDEIHIEPSPPQPEIKQTAFKVGINSSGEVTIERADDILF
jgi:hypothetical protein